MNTPKIEAMTKMFGCLMLSLLIHCKNNDGSQRKTVETANEIAKDETTAVEQLETKTLAAPNPEDFKTMKHCPSGVEDSSTKVVMKEGAPMVLVVSEQQGSVDAIRKRGQYLAGLKNERGDVKHLGNGQGGGLLGKCPVVVGSIARLEEHPQGIRVFLKDKTISSKDLFEMASTRLDALGQREPISKAQKAHGSGKGKGNGGGQGAGKVRGIPKQ